jgi:nucleoside-diphosphate-sugar epimerase
MKVLVTGSKGLIGTALSSALRSQGIDVKGIDIRYEQAHREQGDILDTLHMQKLIEDCEGIVHLAGVSRVVLGEKNRELCWKTNVEATEHLLEQALTLPQKPWFLYASSREVYGQKIKLPVQESSHLEPLNIYGKSKAAAETKVLAARERGLITAVVRYSNVYGSIHDYPDRVIPAFCRAAAEGKEMYVEGVENLFDFTHLDDTVVGTLSLIELLMRGEQRIPTIHLTTGRPTSLLEAAEIALGMGEPGTRIIETAPRNFDVSTFYGDTTLAKTVLGWESQIFLKQGMERLILDYKQCKQLCDQDVAVVC